MARIDKRRTKGARTNARPLKAPAKRSSTPAKRSRTPAIEDTMFFPRLRRHTKWMFVALALVFGLGFVIFGVGAGGTGIGDIFNNRQSGGGGISVAGALQQTQQKPKVAKGWRDLSTAYQTQGNTDAAVAALVRYTQLAPKDAGGFRELGGLYLAQARSRSQDVQLAQLRAAYSGSIDPPGVGLIVRGQPVVSDPITAVLARSASAAVSTAAAARYAALQNAVSAYQSLAALSPNDPNTQFELGSDALQAGNTVIAIQAFTRFLRLAPLDPNAPLVRKQLKQLGVTSGGSPAGKAG